jgi:hypothetical protein
LQAELPFATKPKDIPAKKRKTFEVRTRISVHLSACTCGVVHVYSHFCCLGLRTC